MSTILICSIPLKGHIHPLLSVAKFLVSQNHRVFFLTGKNYRQAVEETRAVFCALPEEADFNEAEILALRNKKASGIRALQDDLTILVERGEFQWRAIKEILSENIVDAIFAEPLFIGAALLVDQPLAVRPPIFYLGVVPLAISSPETAPFGFGLKPWNGFLGQFRNRILEKISHFIFKPVQKKANEIHQKLYKKPMNLPMVNWAQRSNVLVQFAAKEFEYPRSTLPRHSYFVGPITESKKTQIPLPDWWSDLDGSKPIIHVTQGTLANADMSELILPTIQALKDEDVLVIVTTGGYPIENLGKMPSNVRVASFLPYDELLPKTDVFVTNGGYGGVQFALRYGIPLVVAGNTEDKAEVGARVEWSGVGVALKTNRPKQHKLRKSILHVLNQASYRANSQKMKEKIAECRGVEEFESILQLLTSSIKLH